jgi:pimeloyl-ACP methyl ester carboxylesterase
VGKALEADYDLIMPDLRGHGKSDPGAGDYTPETRAADLIGLIEALSLDKPVIGGHSIGGITALYTAALRPDLISGYFLEDPTITLPGESLFGGQPVQDSQAALKRLTRAWRLLKAAPKFLGRGLARRLMPAATPEVLDSWLESKQRVSEDFIQALEEPGWLAIGLDDELLPRIQLPGLLIYGDREAGAIVSHTVAEGLANLVADLQVVHLAGATHDIRRIQFEGYLEAVRDFLRTVLDR